MEEECVHGKEIRAHDPCHPYSDYGGAYSTWQAMEVPDNHPDISSQSFVKPPARARLILDPILDSAPVATENISDGGSQIFPHSSTFRM